MLEVRVFRFNPKTDVISYLKPYIYGEPNFADVRELLRDVQKGDPYFSFDSVGFVKINGTIISLEMTFDEVLREFGEILYITPLSEKEASKDLECKSEIFLSKFSAFSSIANDDDFDFYATLAPYFYSTKIPNFSETFLGNSAFVFANHLLEKYPQKKSEILNFIASQLPYYAPCDALGLEYDVEVIFDSLSSLIRFDEGTNNKILTAQAMSEYDCTSAKHRFNGFKIAVWDDENAEILARNLGAQIVEFECESAPLGDKIYTTEKECALRLAGEVLLDAFDSGSDFLLVNSNVALKFLDGKSSEICALFNRSLDGFYILSTEELIALARGDKPDFAARKLKPGLV